MSSLFRPEVLAGRRDAWLGEAQIVQPLAVATVSVVCAVLVLALGAFAVFGTYTRRVHAEGVLAPRTGLITIASPSAGRIGSAAAREGESVDKGQLLFVIDVDAVSASGRTQEQVLEQLRAQVASIARQRQVRASVATIEKKALRDQLANTIAQESGRRRQAALQADLTRSLKLRADQLNQALAGGLARSSNFQSQNYLYIQANAQLAEVEQSDLQLAGRIAELDAKLAEFDGALTRDLTEMDRQIAVLRQAIAESDARRAIEVRAPEKGVLTSLRVHAGQQVQAGGTLLTLLPSSGELRADLFVDSSAIGFVDKGEPVMLRYAAFPFQRFGLHRGEVAEVTRAPIGVRDEAARVSASNAAWAGPGVYRIEVAPDRGYVVANGETRALEAGMQVEADIALEKRPLFKWLLDPVSHLRRSATLVTQGATR